MNVEVKTERINKRNVIRLANNMNKLKHNLSAVSIDILYFIIANIRREDEEFDIYEITIKELETSLKRKLNKVSLNNALKELYEDEVYFLDEPFDTFRLFQTCIYDSANSIIVIKLSEKLKEYLLNLSNKFFKVNFDSLLKLKSRYSKLLYMQLCQYKNMKKVQLDLEVLNEIFNTPVTLKNNYGNFKQRILNPTLKNLNKLDEFDFIKIKEYKRVKRVEFLEFTLIQDEYISKKNQKLAEQNIRKIFKKKDSNKAVDDWLASQKEEICSRVDIEDLLAKNLANSY